MTNKIIIDVGKNSVIIIVNGVKKIINLLDNGKQSIAELVSSIIDKELK